MSNYTDGPALVGIELTPVLYRYLVRLMELGIFQGPNGSMKISPQIQPLVDGVHNILAGGATTVQITTPGNPQILAELDNLVKDGTDQANDINGKLGFYLAPVP